MNFIVYNKNISIHESILSLFEILLSLYYLFENIFSPLGVSKLLKNYFSMTFMRFERINLSMSKQDSISSECRL